MPAKKKEPASFEELDLEALTAAALHFGANEDGNEDEIRADLEATGVTWNDYAQAFGLKEITTVIKSNDVSPAKEDKVTEETVVTVDASPVLSVSEKYLIKFIGDNPYFEEGKYKFTKDDPYAIMPAADAQKALVNEPDKFRQAFPAELQEYYDM